jgi:hypothetical protein
MKLRSMIGDDLRLTQYRLSIVQDAERQAGILFRLRRLQDQLASLDSQEVLDDQ